MSEINQIKRLIAESEGLELSNWNTATHVQREAWASIETQGRAWIIDFITTIESQKEEIESLNNIHKGYAHQSKVIESGLNSQIESLKAITELAEKGLIRIENINFPTWEDPLDILKSVRLSANTTLSEIEKLQNG